MAEVLVRPWRWEDVSIADRLRAADLAECRALGYSPREAVEFSMTQSAMAWTAVVDCEPVMVFGCSPCGGRTTRAAWVWAFGTTEVEKHPRAVVRLGRQYTDLMLQRFQHLLNYVDARNEASVRWLAAIGYAISPARSYGKHGLPFHFFEVLGERSSGLLRGKGQGPGGPDPAAP